MTTEREILDEIFPTFINDCCMTVGKNNKMKCDQIERELISVFKQNVNVFDEYFLYFCNNRISLRYRLLCGDGGIRTYIFIYINKHQNIMNLLCDYISDYMYSDIKYQYMVINNFHYIASLIRPMRVKKELDNYFPNVLCNEIWKYAITDDEVLYYVDAEQIKEEHFNAKQN